MENYKQLNYTIKHTTRKNSIALVFHASHAEVRVPKRTSKRVIEKFLEKHYAFILEKIANTNIFNREYKTGEKILIGGEKYTLNIILAEVNDIQFNNLTLNLFVKTDDYNLKKELLENYLRKITQLDIQRLVNKYAKIMQLYPTAVKINKAEKRWGSCNYVTKTLNFTLRNAMLADWVQEYIVIHELAHLKHPDHSVDFWNHVEHFMPDYKEAEKYIKINSELLSL